MSEGNRSDFDAEAAAWRFATNDVTNRGAKYRLTLTRRFDRKPTIRDVPFDSTDQLIDRSVSAGRIPKIDAASNLHHGVIGWLDYLRLRQMRLDLGYVNQLLVCESSPSDEPASHPAVASYWATVQTDTLFEGLP